MKIFWLFILTITSIFANEFYAKLEPVESYQVKSFVS